MLGSGLGPQTVMMKVSEFLLRARQNGSRPGFSSVVVGVVGLVGGGIGAGIGFSVALRFLRQILEPIDLEDPGSVFAFAMVFFAVGGILILGSLFGLVVGSVALPALVTSLLRWEKTFLTVVFIVLIDIAAVPLLSALVLVLLEDASDIAGLVTLVLAALVIGGLVPGFARWLSLRLSSATRRSQHCRPASPPIS